MSNSAEDGESAVNFIVGGVFYSLLRSDIQAHKDCYFASVIKDEWNETDQPIVIDRDGIIFRHILVYIYNCRYKLPFIVKGPLSQLVAIRREADYYNLPALVALYDSACKAELTSWCKTYPLRDRCLPLESEEKHRVSELDALVHSTIYPACHTGILNTPWINEFATSTALSGSQSQVSDEKYHNYYHLKDRTCQECLYELQEHLSTMPGVKCCLDVGSVYAITKGGYSHSVMLGTESVARIGAVVYILNSHYTGGVITVTRNGVSKSITKPGEYIMYTSECSRDISTVTSGTLVFAKLDIVNDKVMTEYGDFCSPGLVPYDVLPAQSDLINAVHRELNHVSSTAGSVVLCLSDLYPIVEFEPTIPYLETDPDSLTGRDAVLYEYLKDTFEVTLVTVYVQRYKYESVGCIVGPAPTSSDTGSKINIIAPFHGFRESFKVCNNTMDSRQEFATLYTAMHIVLKEETA